MCNTGFTTLAREYSYLVAKHFLDECLKINYQLYKLHKISFNGRGEKQQQKNKILKSARKIIAKPIFILWF